jgi:hypothetical protein
MPLLIMLGSVLAMWAVLALIGAERDQKVREIEARVEAARQAKQAQLEAALDIPVVGSATPRAARPHSPRPPFSPAFARTAA